MKPGSRDHRHRLLISGDELRELKRHIQDDDNERHDEMLEWVGGSFDPEAFDPAVATKSMKKGLPDWRRMV